MKYFLIQSEENQQGVITMSCEVSEVMQSDFAGQKCSITEISESQYLRSINALGIS